MATISSLGKKNTPHSVPEDPFSPSATVGLSEIGERCHSPSRSLSPSMPLLHGLAGPAGNGSRGAAAAQITPKSALSLGKRVRAQILWSSTIGAEQGD